MANRTMADRAHSRRRYEALRAAGLTAGQPDRENNGREALAREPEPARGHASMALIPRGENDSTHNLDR